jgi:phosphoribosyl-ATP pyrophosphohydrolase/phosphoribosyl-AMP cyclohydrolase/histidinol dehydrogenase
MSVSLLPSINIATYSEATKGLSPTSLRFIGSVFSSVTPETLDLTFQYLQQTVGSLSAHLDVTLLGSVEDIVSLLDAGAAKVVVNKEQLNGLESVKNLDLDRVVLLVTGVTKQEIIDAIGGKTIGIFAAFVTDVEFIEAWLNEYGTDHPPVYVSFATPTEEHTQKVAKLGGIPVVPAELLTVDTENNTGLIDVAKLVLAGATSDRPDGLFTTLVTDERGVALGLVYSSEKSVAESLKTGRGVYQSRKRGLWYKGESSGDVQELLRINLDCDRDCLQFVVRQKGRGKKISKWEIHLLIMKKDSAILVLPLVLETILACLDYKKLSRIGRSLPLKDHIPPVSSTTLNY